MRHVATLVLLLATLRCSSLPAEPSKPAPASSFRLLLQGVREKYHQPALVAGVVRSDGSREVDAVGVRSRESNQAVLCDDVFALGSCGKTMTACLAALLVASGDLAFELPLSEALPDLDLHPGLRPVTLRLLLGHRAGLPPWEELEDAAFVLSAQGDPAEDRRLTVEQLLRQPPRFAPGSRFEYSNAGYVVVAYLMERVTAIPFEHLLRERILGPLEMKDTGFGWPRGERAVQGHVHWNSEPCDPPAVPLLLSPAGHMHSTVGDLCRFAFWVLEHMQRAAEGAGRSPLSEFWRLPQDERPAGYALGFAWRAGDGAPVFWHNGTSGVNFAQISWAPGAGRAVVVLSNAASGRLACEALTDSLLRESSP